jgi:hypothetical protein
MKFKIVTVDRYPYKNMLIDKVNLLVSYDINDFNLDTDEYWIDDVEINRLEDIYQSNKSSKSSELSSSYLE